MPAVARMSGTDIVASPDGNPSPPCPGPIPRCDSPSIQATQAGSGDVRVNGIGVVRAGDAMKPHKHGCGCPMHAPTLSSFSGTVRVNSKGVGRLFDNYSAHVIASGSGNVFAGG